MDHISPRITKKTSIADTYPVTVSDVASWLKLSAGMATLESDNITRLIKTMTDVFERYLWIYLRRTTFEAYYDLDYDTFYSFITGDLKLTLERSPIIALTDISKIEYLDTDGTWTEFDRGAVAADGLYENTTEKHEQRGWASVYFRNGISYDNRYNAYKIRITFTAGFTSPGETPLITDVPETLKQALLIAIAYYYTNRGDCGGCDCNMNGFPIPCDSKALADQYSVRLSMGAGGSYNPWGIC